MAELDEAEKPTEDEADIHSEREASAERTAAALQSGNEAIWHEESEAAEAMEMDRVSSQVVDMSCGRHANSSGIDQVLNRIRKGWLDWRQDVAAKARYKMINKISQHLNPSNIEQQSKEILRILEEGKIQCSTQGPSIFEKLVEKSDYLFRVPSFSTLVKALFPSFESIPKANREDIAKIIRRQCPEMREESHAEETVAKLKIFLPLRTDLRTRLLRQFIKDCSDQERNSHFVNVLTFLTKEGADAFEPIEETDSSTLFLKKFSSHLPESLVPSVSTFLEEVFKKWGFSATTESILNDVIKAVPKNVFRCVISHRLPIKEVIIRNCLEMIRTNPTLCDHIDSEGKTPLHNLLEKHFVHGPWKILSKYVAESDSLMNLLSQLTSDKNVNMKDKDQVTPHCWILLWQESLTFWDLPDKEKLSRKIFGIEQHLQEFGACKENSLEGLNYLRENQMENLLKRWINLEEDLGHKLKRSESTSVEITAACEKELEVDLNRIKDLRSRGCGRCITRLTESEDFDEFVERHFQTRNDKILGIYQDVLQVMIDETSAQGIYDILFQHVTEIDQYIEIYLETNYYVVFHALKRCLEKGAIPTKNEICQVSLLTLAECATYEALLATIQMVEQLICAYRGQGNTDPIEIFMNPIQDQ